MQTWGAGVWAPWGRAEKVALPFIHRCVGDRPLVGSRSTAQGLSLRSAATLRTGLGAGWEGGSPGRGSM